LSDIIQPISDEFKDIFFIKGQRDGRYPYSHSLLIKDYLIDTGISSGFLRKLKRKFEIKNIILSHWHEDHISGNRIFPNAKFFCHNNDKLLVEDFSGNYKKFYLVEDTLSTDLYDDLLKLLKVENTKVDNTIEDNDIIEISEDYQIKVIHTPGHSAGHCCFYELSSKIAFLADVDFSSFGPWYAGLDSDLIDFEESIAKLKKLDIDIAVTSHKGVFLGVKIIKQELDEFQAKIDERDILILENFSESKPLTSKDLMKKNIIYKFYSEFEEYEIIAEKIMLDMHFDKFLKNNLIEQKDNGYILS
jgi:glyoxylase-like metal-dependent hydrolase (beta-lactamase superfamily II)